MAVQPIIRLGDPRLRAVCIAVSDPASPRIHGIVADLRDTLRDAREKTGYGRAIAAPQIGVLERVVYLAVPGLEPFALVNPVIVTRSVERMIVWDACLSFLEIFMQVERFCRITVEYTDLAGVLQRLEAGSDHDLSELLQHEIDHLDGMLSVDRTVDSSTFCVREIFESQYRDASPYVTAGQR